MKRFLMFFSIAFLAIVTVLWVIPMLQEPFPSERLVEVTYAAILEGLPEKSGPIRIWIPLASSREGQTILKREIKAPLAYQITADPAYGNEMVYFEIRKPAPESLTFEVNYAAKISRQNFASASSGEKNLGKYLKPSQFMVVDDEVKKRTQNAVGAKKSWQEKARAIYEDVIRRMSYDKTVPGWGRGDTVRACLLGKGNCTDFHSLFISMAHAAEIPARFKIGLTIPDESEGEIPGYHCWAEFYEEGKGWRPVDASEAWKHPERKEAYFGKFDTNKFLISVGRDIDLVPKQAGPPVNIFFYPYVEVDGKEWNGAKTLFQFRNLKT
ncbi:MAG: transglutaminase domain-containing protein [Candidatus Omnitrophica bacterium]|nr:transglutaminase domain-containing protein [Candidatus Omnitrophota bacterium]